MSSLVSALRILQCLTPETPRLKVSEIAERLDLPKSTVSRLLKTLSEGGVLDRDEETRQYFAGPRALQLGGLYMAQNDLMDFVDEAVLDLVNTYGFVGYIGVLDDLDVIIIRHRQGSYPLKYVLPVGTRQFAPAAALGIGLLAQLDEGEVETLAETCSSDPDFDPEVMKANIASHARSGFIEVSCKPVPGISAIGSAVHVPGSNEPPIGYSLSFPEAAANAAMRKHMSRSVASISETIRSRFTAIPAL